MLVEDLAGRPAWLRGCRLAAQAFEVGDGGGFRCNDTDDTAADLLEHADDGFVIAGRSASDTNGDQDAVDEIGERQRGALGERVGIDDREIMGFAHACDKRSQSIARASEVVRHLYDRELAVLRRRAADQCDAVTALYERRGKGIRRETLSIAFARRRYEDDGGLTEFRFHAHAQHLRLSM